MRYLIAKKLFLRQCGTLSTEERAAAIEAFDKTLLAANARFLDAWDEFMHTFLDTIMPWRKW